MAVNAAFNRLHPRHKENGRFREKNGSDATAYARRISAKIAASRGGGGDDKADEHAKRTAPAKRTAAKAAPQKQSTDAQQRRRAAAYDRAEAKRGGPKPSKAELDRTKKAAHANGAETKTEIDANLHKRYKDASVAELRSIIKALAEEHRDKKPGSMGNPAIGDSLARLIEKKTGD